MSERRLKGVCFFGGFEEDYSRIEVLRKGLEALDVRISFCRVSPKRKVLKRYFSLFGKYMAMDKSFEIIFVPVFRHKDIPLAWVLAKLTGKKLIFDPLVSRFETKIKDRRDAGERSFQSWYNRLIDRISLRLPDMVIADTQAHSSYYEREFGVSKDKLSILRVGFDETVFRPDAFKASKHVKGSKAIVLFFGSYLPLHGTDIIVRAAELMQNREDVIFKLIGSGQTFSRAEGYASSKGLGNVDFVAHVPYQELPSHIMQADICLGIFGETDKAKRVIPNKIFQCMAMGKPVITASTDAVKEIFTDNENIALVPPKDPLALAEKIGFLLAHAPLTEKIAKRGSELVNREFTGRAIGGRFLRYCEYLA